jgi:hypothetical protein
MATSGKKGKKAKNVAGTWQTLSNLFFLLISMRKCFKNLLTFIKVPCAINKNAKNALLHFMQKILGISVLPFSPQKSLQSLREWEIAYHSFLAFLFFSLKNKTKQVDHGHGRIWHSLANFWLKIFEIQKMRFYWNLNKKEHFEKCKQLLEYQYYL